MSRELFKAEREAAGVGVAREAGGHLHRAGEPSLEHTHKTWALPSDVQKGKPRLSEDAETTGEARPRALGEASCGGGVCAAAF